MKTDKKLRNIQHKLRIASRLTNEAWRELSVMLAKSTPQTPARAVQLGHEAVNGLLVVGKPAGHGARRGRRCLVTP